MVSFGWPETDEKGNEISEGTRRDIFDALRLDKVHWWGRLAESEFLSRIFDLTTLPSDDHRCSTMSGDLHMHREHFVDWEDDWVYGDPRLDLLRGPDSVFLQFLTEMLHPVVRATEEEVDKLLELFNVALSADGYRLSVKAMRSGRRIFAAGRTLGARTAGTETARKVANDLNSSHVMDQVTRMEASIISDPALAIGSAKEFLESMCKAILAARKFELTGKEDLPKLVKSTREALNFSISHKTDETIKSTLGAMATLVGSVSELRGQLGTGHGAHPSAARPPVEVARLVVGIATTLGLFLWESHQSGSPPTSP